jgi:RNA polymerase sigma factor (sigma-70 family)
MEKGQYPVDVGSEQLLARFQAGEVGAADEIFRRYVARLTVFARARLASRVARRVDPEDVVLSAYRSFFIRARDGRVNLRRSGDLWRLLVAFTLNKLRHQVAHHRALKRSIGREEESFEATTEAFAHRDPCEHAVAAADELEQIMAALSPVRRRILELRLLDHSVPEIAVDIDRSERTVKRLLARIIHERVAARRRPAEAE